jgi:hypothetical protein
MHANRTHRLLLWCAATDNTYQVTQLAGVPVLVGKCIHCNSKLVVAIRPNDRGISNATIEHIVPRTHGGTDAVENLACACARCNGTKGVHMDPRAWSDPGLQSMIETLQSRRAKRMREPPASLSMPAWSEPEEQTQPESIVEREADAPSGRRGRGRSTR